MRVLQFEEGGQQQSGSQTGERSANGATSTSNGQDAAQQKRANRYKSPLPTGVPLPLPEHESLHTYVQRARNISMFSIAFTLLCAIVGLVFAWSTNRHAPSVTASWLPAQCTSLLELYKKSETSRNAVCGPTGLQHLRRGVCVCVCVCVHLLARVHSALHKNLVPRVLAHACSPRARMCSSALLGYGLESLVDVWSSILVLWRFWGDPEGEGSYFLVTRRREARASVGIAVTFVIIGYITCWQVRCSARLQA